MFRLIFYLLICGVGSIVVVSVAMFIASEISDRREQRHLERMLKIIKQINNLPKTK